MAPMTLSPVDELALLLRPAGAGVHLVSTGRAEQVRLQERLYGVSGDPAIREAFLGRLARIAEARVVILGVPSDVGAGFRRGANLAPGAIRAALLDHVEGWSSWCEAERVLDLGDVFVVPQLLHDDMLSEAQLRDTRRALYPGGHVLPVSPLSIEERALELILKLAPNVRPFVLGGDHSVAWPVASQLAKHHPDLGIVQPDAHTDLLPDRLGIRYCFATWSYHANEAIGRRGRLVQVGIRASRFDRAHWESTLGVRQFWADEIVSDPAAALEAIVAHVIGTGVSGVYFSNDIDGTDPRHAASTGTPEPGGVDPDFLCALITRLGRDVGLVAGDLVEVAPPLGSDEDRDTTLRTAVRYVKTTVEAMLRS